MTPFLSGTAIEQSLLSLFEAMGYETLHGPEIAHDGSAPERKNHGTVVLLDRLRGALERIYPLVPPYARVKKVG